MIKVQKDRKDKNVRDIERTCRMRICGRYTYDIFYDLAKNKLQQKRPLRIPIEVLNPGILPVLFVFRLRTTGLRLGTDPQLESLFFI